MDDITHGGQVGHVHLVFQTGHGCLTPGPPSINIKERLALLIESSLSVGDAHRRVFKPSETAVVFVGLHRASQTVGVTPAVGKVKAGLKAGLGCRS